MLFRRPNRSRTSRGPVQSFTLPARWKARPRLETLDERIVPAFLDPVNYAVGTYPNAVITGDFNNDSVEDLAFANWGDRTVSVLLGNADGTFDPAISSAAGNAPTSLAIGDLNNDGNLDLVTGDPNYGNTADVTVLLGQGNGTFQAPASLEVRYGWYDYGVESVAVGDFNGDGLLDIEATSTYVWSSYYGSGYYGVAAVLMGTGTGTFGSPNWSYLIDGFNTDAAVADFNEDGRLDIASVSDYGYTFIGLGTGSGTFNWSNYFYNPGFEVVAEDLNNDGNVDLATANYYYGTVSVLLGDGLGSFTSPQSYAAGEYPSSLAAADFNDDGILDLVTSNSQSATVSVLLGTGPGAFKPPVSAAAGSTPWGVVASDFDGDGLMDAASANNSSHNVSILINDGDWPALDSPSITINDVTVTEGNSGTVNATFTVSLTAASSQTVTIHYATADGSATTAGGDYQAVSGDLTFIPSDTSETITVPVNGDRVVEFAESFVVVLTDPTNAFVADAMGAGTITDDEPRASIDYGPVYVTEGNSGTTNAVFTIRLSNAYDQPVDVNYATSNGSATAGSDYQAVDDTVTFAPGETVKTVTVPVYGDRLTEYDEGFYVTLAGANGYGYGIIRDDEPRASIDYGPVYVVEGNSGTTNAVFTIRLSNAYDQAVEVDYASSNGSATAGSDYQAVDDTVTFAPGETVKTISVPVYGDRVGESDESFYVSLTGSGSYGYGVIQDNEPRISIDSPSIREGHRGTQVMTFTVSLAFAYDEEVTVNFATHDGSATAGSDYEATSGRVTFAAGETTKTISVVIKGDKRREGYSEYFYILLSDASANASIYNAYGYGTILDDDHGRGGGKP